jgi:MFS transporter, PPP family, 3-phenylpropionic acid transporter
VWRRGHCIEAHSGVGLSRKGRMPDRQSPSQTGQLAPFAALSASYLAHVGFFNPYLSLWLKDLGLSLLAISLLTSVQAATRIFAPYVWGAVSDATGERVKLLRWGASVALVVSLGLWIDLGVAWLALVLLLMFSHTSAMMPMSEAAMAHLVSNSGAFDAKRYGRVRLWGSVGFLVAVLLAGAWFERFGMSHFPAWTGLTLLLVLVSAWRLPDHKEEAHRHHAKLAVWPVLRQPPVRWLFASVFFHVLSHMGTYVFISLYLDALGYSKALIGFLWAVAVLAEIGWFFTQSRWMGRLSLSGWLVFCAAATVLRMGLTATSASILGVLVLAQMLNAVTFAAHHSACIALISQHFPGRLRARGQALYTVIGYGFPGVLGSLAGGAISEKYGLGHVFTANFATSLIALACTLRVWRLQHRATSATG